MREKAVLSKETIKRALLRLNAAENSRPTSTVEQTSDRIDAVMAPDVHGWRNGSPVASRAEEREAERIGFGALTDYHRDFEHLIIDAPMACITWAIRGTFGGRDVLAQGTSVFEFRDDGLIQRYWMYVNPADFWYRAEYLAALSK